MRDRDIIIFYENEEGVAVIVNGIVIDELTNLTNISFIMRDIFNRLEYSYNRPMIYNIIEQAIEFSYGEIEALWERQTSYTDRIFTEDELQILYETDNLGLFLSEVSKNLQPRASELDKAIQEM